MLSLSAKPSPSTAHLLVVVNTSLHRHAAALKGVALAGAIGDCRVHLVCDAAWVRTLTGQGSEDPQSARRLAQEALEQARQVFERAGVGVSARLLEGELLDALGPGGRPYALAVLAQPAPPRLVEALIKRLKVAVVLVGLSEKMVVPAAPPQPPQSRRPQTPGG
ncbi:MAG: hypothetical protein SFU83_11225 [Meiothermus sp.]|nr:hypothetical protein [Meiothermus sp.]